MAAFLLEEAYEAVEAVEGGQGGQICGELGDLAFHIVFLAELFAEQGGFNLVQVLEAVEEKMIRRHPHVFGATPLADAQAVRRQWGRIKDQERGEPRGGLLESLPRAIPALSRAARLGQRAARVRFDWPGAPQVWDKVREELAELQEAPEAPRAQEELGDLLFSLAQWARHRGLDPEAALRGANRRFEERFAHMEALAANQGRQLGQMEPAELEELWQAAKGAKSQDHGGQAPG